MSITDMMLKTQMMVGTYEERKVVPKVEPKENKGIGVSTAYVYDVEQYETALQDQSGWHPVERYNTKEEAIEGHKRWLEQSSRLKEVVILGAEEWGTENEEIVLEPFDSPEEEA